MVKPVKIFLAVILFLCLADMPYGYYQFVRFSCFVGFALLAFNAKSRDKDSEIVIYGILSLLFQPFFPITLGRELWVMVDLVVGGGLLVSTFHQNRMNTNIDAH